MNLINLTTGEYPFSLWQLRRDNLNVSFPANPTDEDIEPFGCRFVHPSDQPAFNPRSEQIEELPPEPDADGTYRQRWQVIPASPEQIAAWDAANAPAPDWARFKAALLGDPAANTALAQALPVAPSAVLALPAALIAAAAGGDPSDFHAAWRALRAADLIPAELLTTIGALAVSCNLPAAFVIELTRPFAQSVGQTWTAPNGSQWQVVQARDPQGQFLADDPATSARESLEWELVA
jgi:hypothetical protein